MLWRLASRAAPRPLATRCSVGGARARQSLAGIPGPEGCDGGGRDLRSVVYFTAPALCLAVAANSRGSGGGTSLGCIGPPALAGQAVPAIQPAGLAPTTAEFRLVVTDLDGTLLDSDGCVSPTNCEALRTVIGPFCPLVLATARGMMERIPFEDLPGPLYILACGGAHGLERHPGTSPRVWELRELFLQGLPEAQARAAVAAAEAEGATVWVVHADRVFVKLGPAGGAESAGHLAKFEPGYAQVVGDLAAALAADRTLEVVAVLPDADAVAHRLRMRLAGTGGNVEVLSMAPDPIVSMKASGVDKGAALRRLCKHLGVPLRAVVAFGDGSNDVPMLRLAGHGVAVANAGAKARAAADVVSAWSHGEHAVGRELMQLRAEGRL